LTLAATHEEKMTGILRICFDAQWIQGVAFTNNLLREACPKKNIDPPMWQVSASSQGTRNDHRVKFPSGIHKPLTDV
jgi:hypothetical protein